MAFTKVRGPGITTTDNYRVGVITATKFVGPFEGDVTGVSTGANTIDWGNEATDTTCFIGFTTSATGFSQAKTSSGLIYNSANKNVTVSGNLTVGGVLQYEDVTNVDSIGVITARSGLVANAGSIVDINGDLDVDGKTDLDDLSVAGVSTFAANVNLNDDIELRFGNDDDASIKVDGSQNFLIQGDATTYLRGATLNLGANGGSGGFHSNVVLRESGGRQDVLLKEDGSTKLTTVPKGISITDQLDVNNINVSAGGTFGDDVAIADKIVHAGDTNTAIRFPGADQFSVETAGSQRLLIDSSGHITPGAANAQDLGSTSKEFRNLYIGAGGTAFFGDAQEVRLYHDGNNTYLKGDANAGLMSIEGRGNVELFAWDKVLLRVNAGEPAVYCNNNSSVDLYYNGGTYTTAKLKTSKVGVTVHGEVAASQDYPNLRPTLDFNFTQVKKLDPRISYTRSSVASYTDEFGIVRIVGDNVPRFDHDPDTRECKGLLIEDQRTNLFLYGTTPGDNWSGSKSGKFEENTTETTAPDGTYTATKWIFTNTDPFIYHTQTLNANNTYTMSMWVKAGTNMSGDVLQMRMGAGPYSTNANSTIPADGSWKRLTFTKTVGGSNETSAGVGFEPQTNPSGNPAIGDVVYIWGAQLEVGNVVSSFIPTNGVIVDRGADVVTIEGEEFTDFYNQVEGTIFLSASYIEDIRSSAIVVIDDTSNESEYTEVGYRAGGASSGGVASYIRTDAGNDQYYKNYASSATQGNEFKVALAYKDNDYASSVNGQDVDTDTSGTTSKVYDRLRFSDVDTVGVVGSGHYRRFIYYSKRLSNNQVVTLTS